MVIDWKLAPSFTREWQGDRDVHIVGAGALGSRYVIRLLGAGAERIHVYDDDVIEVRNTINQPAYLPYVGIPKAEALQHIAAAMGKDKGIVTPHLEKVRGPREMPGIILMGLDTLSDRRLVGETCAKERENVSFLGDGRMGASGGRAYGLNPNNDAHVDRFFDPKTHLKPDPVEDLGGCVQTPAAAATADIVAAMALWRLGRWLHLEQGCADPYVNYVGFEFVPTDFYEVECWA